MKGFLKDKVRFEIRVRCDDRWTIDSVYRTRDEAMEMAQGLRKEVLGDRLQVYRVQIQQDGVIRKEEVILDLTVEGKEKKLNVRPIESAPFCEDAKALYGLPARRTIGRLFKDFLAKWVITPTELVYTYGHLQRLNDTDSLLPSGVDRVATLQAREKALDAKERRDALYAMFEEIKDRARMTELRPLEEEEDGFRGLLARSGGIRDPKGRHVVMTALAAHLAGGMGWSGKLERVMNLFHDDVEMPVVMEFDGIMAELLEMNELIEELLGRQPDLAAVLGILTGVATGRYEIKKWDDPKLGQLTEAFKAHPLKVAQQVLLQTVCREMKARKPLTQEGTEVDKKRFFELLALLLQPDGFLGGNAMAEALAIRYARILSRDDTVEDTGKAIQELLEELNSVKFRLWFLLSLANTPFGKANGDVIAQRVSEITGELLHVTNISYFRNSAKRKMMDLAGLQRLALSCMLPNNVNQTIAVRLDELQYDFLVEEQIVEKMDNPEDTLYERAKRMLGFCGSNILTQGKSDKMVRSRVQAHLKQPNFIEKYTAGVSDSGRRDAMVRELHKLVARAGLG